MARKGFDDLSPAYRRRLDSFGARVGLSGRQVHADETLTRRATGHGETPRSPWQALRYPDLYQGYTRRRADELALLASSDRGRRTILAGIGARTSHGQPGVIPYSPTEVGIPGGFLRSYTFQTEAEARAYLADPQGRADAAVLAGAALIAFDPRTGNWSVWFAANTP